MIRTQVRYLFVASISVFALKIFTDALKLATKNFEAVNSVVNKIGNLNGIYTQSAATWNPNLDKSINFGFLIIFFILIKSSKYKRNNDLSIKLIFLTFILGAVIFSSNILTNEYRGWDLFLYCEISPIYNGTNPYLIDKNGLTSVYSPLVWNILYTICNVELVNTIVYSYYIWIYTGLGVYIFLLIRNQKVNFQNIFISLAVVLTFLGTNYHGIKTGNIGYLLGMLLAYSYLTNIGNSNSRLQSVVLGVLLTIKPFYLFWFGLLYAFNKLFQINVKVINNLNLILWTIFTLIFVNLVFYKKEFIYFLENLLQINESINKPLNDKAGFLNLNFQDYIFRMFERYFGIELNKILIILITLIILYYFKHYLISKSNTMLLPVFVTPRFKSYDLTFLYVLFRKNNIYIEFILFCTMHSIIFIFFSFTGAGYLIEISYVLIFILYLNLTRDRLS